MATAKGRLNLDCIAADSNSTHLYGIASAEGPDGKVHAVLVKSNVSPSSLANITWTLVSSSPGDELSFGYPKFLSVDCAVSNSGAFSAFFRPPSKWSTRTYDMHPMGVRYDPVQEKWFSVRGSREYGWLFDRVVHKSFYLDETAVHVLTQDFAYFVRLGVVDTERNVLHMAGCWRRDGINDYERESRKDFIYQPVYGHYNLTRPGFFSRERADSLSPLSFTDDFHEDSQKNGGLGGGGRFYVGSDMQDMASYYNFDSAMGPPMIDTKLIGPEAYFRLQYLVSGVRGNGSFVGVIVEDDESKQLYTAELRARPRNSWNTTFTPHNLTLIDIDNKINSAGKPTNYIVNENFVTVGGRLAGQEPFAVALTSNGLYEIGLFGNASATSTGAGVMKGPYFVDIASSTFTSNQPYRFYDPVDITGGRGSGLEPEEILFMTFGFLALVSTVIFYRNVVRPCWNTRKQRRKLEWELNGPGERWFKGMMRSIRAKPGLERYSLGMIPERQVVHSVQRQIPNGGGGGSVGDGVNAPVYSYQDELQGLELSRHPRPNIVTSVGDS